jgi:hypothetical protein
MKIKCINSEGTDHIFKGATYKVIDFSNSCFLIETPFGNVWATANRFAFEKRNELDISSYSVIRSAETIEDVICLSTLIGSGLLLPDADLECANNYRKALKNEDCENCKLVNKCLAVRINE